MSPVQGNTLGIVAGGGELPIAIARAAEADGRNVFVVAIEGMASSQEVAAFRHGWASLGELGKTLKLLKDAGCSEVTIAGRVPRPQFNALKLDARGALALPRIIAAAMKGDDALLRAVLAVFEKEGLRVIGSDEATRDLLGIIGPFATFEPEKTELADIALGVKVVRALGALDIGQGAVVCEGLVLAVEAAEGTDAMLRRVATLPENIRGTPDNRRGVMVKMSKPHQERRVDLPTIGMRTVELVSAAGLSGIAFDARSTLLMDRKGLAEAADGYGVFLFGFDPDSYSS